MKKRVTRRSHNGDSLLPMTQADAASSSTKGKKRGRSRGAQVCGPVTFFFAVVLLSLLVVVGVVFYITSEGGSARPGAVAEKIADVHNLIQKKVTGQKKKKFSIGHKLKERMYKEIEDEKVEPHVHDSNLQNQKDLPLYKFESLRFALEHSELVLLYFGASWCPVCSPVTEQLNSLFRLLLLPLPALEENMELKGLMKKNHGVSLVYVSSDRSQEEMEGNQKDNWWSVPYDSPDRDNLKRHFKTCAKAEMEALGLENREHEIPTLLVIAGATHEVVRYDGVQDIKDRGQKAVDYWLKLLLKSQGEGGDLDIDEEKDVTE